jgi:hypothetical protein
MNTQNYKKYIAGITIANLLFSLILPISILANSNIIFSDDFSSRNFSRWDSYDSWYIEPNQNNRQNYWAEIKGTVTDSSLTKTIPTVGYRNIVLQYKYKAQHLNNNDHIRVEWFDGTQWVYLADISQNANQWVQKIHQLPEGANDNPNFKFRFRAILTANNDTFSLDDVLLTGESIPPSATLIIIKDAIPDDPQDFEFILQSLDGNFSENFFLDDDQDGTLPNQKTFTLAAGTYSIEERLPLGWDLTSATCSDGSDISAINLSPGKTVTCTFTNTKRGSITVVKVADPDTGDFLFTLTGPNPDNIATTTIRGSGGFTFENLLPGTYSLIETTPEGWSGKTEVNCGNQNPDFLILSPGAQITCYFNNTEYAVINGYKWKDLNADGQFDEGEPGLEGWEIFIDENGDGQLDENESFTTTDGNGYYQFINLEPGTYSICEVEKENWFRSYPMDSNCQNVEVLAGGIGIVYFGNYQKGSISGINFEDLNGNGQFNDGEPTLSGWTIELYDETGENLISTTTTNEGGVYIFSGLKPDTYVVKEILKDGWVQTGAYTYTLPILSGENVANINFGNFKLVKVSGYKWNDLDNDGVWDEEEPALANWEIRATKDEITKTTSTDENGYYEFTFGPEEFGEWVISENLQSSWKQTFPTSTNNGSYTITISESGQNFSEFNFGNIYYQENLGVKFAASSGDFASTTALFVLEDASIEIPVEGGTSTIFLPGGTIITREDGSNIDFTSLTATTVSPASLSGLGTGIAIAGVLKWGLENLGLIFSQPITISIFVGTNLDGQTLSILRSISGTGNWTNDGIVPPATCIVSNGLCTFQATKASYYVATYTSPPSPPTPTPTPTAGGGGYVYGLTILPGSVRVSDIGETNVTITWTTSLFSTSRVIYSRSDQVHILDLEKSNYGYAYSKEGDDSGFERVIYHSVTLSDLKPATTYYFRVVSQSGSIAISDEYTFTTKGVAGITTERPTEEKISPPTEQKISPPAEEIPAEEIPIEKEIPPVQETQLPEVGLTGEQKSQPTFGSSLLASLSVIGNTPWMIIGLILVACGIVYIGVVEWKRMKKKQ